MRTKGALASRGALLLLLMIIRTATSECSSFCPISMCGFELAHWLDCATINSITVMASLAKSPECVEQTADLLCAFLAAQNKINRATNCAPAAGGFCKAECEAINSCQWAPSWDCDSPLYVFPEDECTKPLPPNEYNRCERIPFPARCIFAFPFSRFISSFFL